MTVTIVAQPTRSGRSIDLAVELHHDDGTTTEHSYRLRLEAGHADPGVEATVTELLQRIRGIER